MFKLFDRTFWRYLTGFILVLVLSIGVLIFTGYYELYFSDDEVEVAMPK